MRRPYRPVLVLLLALAAAGCGGSSASSSAGGSAASAGGNGAQALPLKQPGRLTVGIEPFGPPFQIPPLSNPSGFEIDVVKGIADRLGVQQIAWMRVPFGKVITAAKTAPWDFDVDEFSITPERQKVVDFSTPYFDANQGVLVHTGTPAASISSIADLRDLRLGAQADTTGFFYIKDTLKPTTTPQVFPSTAVANLAVKAKRVDAQINDLPIMLSVARGAPDDLKVVGQISTGDRYGIVFAKGSPLRDRVDQAIAQMKSDGTLLRLQEKWKLTDTNVPLLH